MRPTEYITERQYSWARRHGISIDEAGYTTEFGDNFFLPLTAEVIGELPRGPGGGPHTDLHAAHSSAALAVNLFFYWRLYNQFDPIISAICPSLVNYSVQGIRFEERCPINWPLAPQIPRNPPQLDVVIRYIDGAEPGVTKAIAIESKFREMYSQDQGPFADCYLAPENQAIWMGLEPLQVVADQIHQGEILFRRLKVAQLIKHILGLNSQFHGTQNFELLYLWYPAPGLEAALHEDEIGRFQQMTIACRPRVNFRAVTYQDLIYTLARNHGDKHGAYVDYLMERYF